MRTYLVYKLEIKGGYVYIGKTNNFEQRIRCHKLNTNIKESYLYQKIRELGGFDKVIATVIDENIPADQINSLEKHYIQLFNCYKGDNPLGLNSNIGGGGLDNHSEEAKARISAAQKGKPKSEETKLKMRKPKHSEESKAKLSASKKGMIRSEEIRNKISASKKGITYSEETKLKMRKPKSEETKLKMRKPKSEEYKAKRAEIMKQYWANKKNTLKNIIINKII